MDRVPAEIQEHILRLWLLCENRASIQSVASKSDIRWLYNTPKVLRITGGYGDKFFKDVIEFEEVLCRCGRAQSVLRQPSFFIRSNRHIGFCNVSYLSMKIGALQDMPSLQIQYAFQCMRTLLDFEIMCSDTDIHVVHLVSTWMSNVPSLCTIRFHSETVFVNYPKFDLNAHANMCT